MTGSDHALLDQSRSSDVRIVDKAICYVIARSHLLVFTHDEVPLDVAGVQVPAGTLRPGESPETAAVRELREETGLHGTVVAALGMEDYDLRPTRSEIARRHYFLMNTSDVDVSASWQAGESDAATGATAITWTCRWLPIEQAHVLAAGLGARVGRAWALAAS